MIARSAGALAWMVLLGCSSGKGTFSPTDGGGDGAAGDGAVTFNPDGATNPDAALSCSWRSVEALADSTTVAWEDDVVADNVRSFFVYESPGPDQVWRTSDDPIGQRTVEQLSATGQFEGDTNYFPGPDGQWGTSDDVITAYSVMSFDQSGHYLKLSVYNKPGSDGVWHTNDDVQSASLSFQNYFGDVPSQELNSTGPGADGIWGTSDDQISSAKIKEHVNEAGDVEFLVATSPGPNGVWGDDDDKVGDRTVVRCGAGGTNFYDDPGPDGVWGTSDDKLSATDQVVSGNACVNACAHIIY